MCACIYAMPIRRFRQRRFNRRRRTAWYNKKYSTAQIARAAWRSAKYIRGLVNSEMFHYDKTLSLGSSQNLIASVVDLEQGDGVNRRTGNSILAKSLTMNGHMYINSSQTTNTRVMIALVQDKQQVADTAPGISDIFTSSTDPHTLINVNTAGRFKILMRRQYTLDSNAAGNNARSLKFFHRLNFHVRYNGTTYADLQKNGLYLVIITSESSMYPTVNLNARLNYHDN